MLESLDRSGTWVFRGQSDASWELIPSIFRGVQELNPPYSKSDAEWLTKMERDVYREFSQLSRKHRGIINNWELLCLGQHYGIPTRLLDWTRLPLAATYFALEETSSQPAAIWCFNLSKYPFPNFLGRTTTSYAHRIDVLLELTNKRRPSFFQEVSKPFVPSMGKIDPKLSGGNEFEEMEDGFFCVVDPPRFDDRIDAQKGVFTIHYSFDDYDLVYNHAQHLRDVELNNGLELIHKLIIPSINKDQFRESLEDIAGLNWYGLYPDLTGIGKHLSISRKSSFLTYCKNER